jgi:hypothetical protein
VDKHSSLFFRTLQGSSIVINPSMSFVVNATVCGISIKAADFDDHDGRWKCHLVTILSIVFRRH